MKRHGNSQIDGGPPPQMEWQTRAFARRNSVFGLNLYNRLATRGNLFLSPFSVSSALAIAFAGARGQTEQQMAEILQFSGDRVSVLRRFASLQSRIGQTQQQVTLHIANSLWHQQGYRFLHTYLTLVRKYCGVSIRPVDYRDGVEMARQLINEWVEEKTEHKIADLPQPTILNSDGSLVLLNAIHFKGNWTSRFKKDQTRSEPFNLLNGQKVQVPMMNQKAEFGYAETETLQVLEMTYEGGEGWSMVVLLPKKTDGLAKLEGDLTLGNLTEWLAEVRKQHVIVMMPKFKMICRFAVESALRAMGMTNAFSEKADFSGMTGGCDLFISALIHQAYVDVNEEGTEAAVATQSTFARLGSRAPTVRMDHPYVFLIRNNDTGSILFMGRVTNPTPA